MPGGLAFASGVAAACHAAPPPVLSAREAIANKKPPFEKPVSPGPGGDGDIDRKAGAFVGSRVLFTGTADKACRFHGERGAGHRGLETRPKAPEASPPTFASATRTAGKKA